MEREHAAGRITKPLRHNGTPYRGMNILLLWGEALAKGYAAPIWMTFKQALELDAHVRKGEHGSLVVYANSITKTETNDKGEDTEREIPFMKGYTVFNVEQIEGLPAHYYAQPENPLPLCERIENADRFIDEHRRHHPARRKSGLLRARPRPDPASALRGFQEQGELLRHRPA